MDVELSSVFHNLLFRKMTAGISQFLTRQPDCIDLLGAYVLWKQRFNLERNKMKQVCRAAVVLYFYKMHIYSVVECTADFRHFQAKAETEKARKKDIDLDLILKAWCVFRMSNYILYSI